MDRRAVSIRDRDRPVIGRTQQLTVGLHRVRGVRSIHHARWQIHIAVRDSALHFVDADAARGELARIELNAHRVFLRAIDEHLGNTRDHRDALRHHRFA